MARIRSMKPEFCTSEAINRLSERCEAHFAKLWTYADDDGRGIDNPRLIKAACWPLRDAVTAEVVVDLQDELEAQGRIRRYEVDGVSCFQVTNWHEHQHPQRPKASTIPPEPARTPPTKPRQRRTKSDVPVADISATEPGHRAAVVGEGDVDVEGVGEGTSGGPPDAPSDFEAFWRAYPRKTDRKAAVDAWPKATKKAAPGELVAAASRYASDPNRDDAYTLHPTTWLNRERWNDPPLPPKTIGTSVGDQNVRLLLGRQEARRAVAGELQA